ncbi:MAG: exodeoxyribonuclease VII small subunit [Acidobacteriota bacterium]|nr:exodeoxyribonuclease VII small subunit [Acidobacteriota bacterium]
MDFEKSLKRLEGIVEKLDEGDVSLENSLELFEEGMKILGSLKGYLEKAEIKIKKLIKNDKGKIETGEYRELSEEVEKKDR